MVLIQKEANVSKIDDLFEPGDSVPVSGIYDVIHDKIDGDNHAEEHRVTALRGEVFPSCRVCRDAAKYRLNLAAEHIKTHHHLKE